jgi:hypothetical protein
MSMAMATRSSRANPSDARIPCPVCGQQIHPVAGRCKHCKTDLVKLREQQGLRAPKVDLAAVGSSPVAAPAPAFAPGITRSPDGSRNSPAAPSNGANGHAPVPETFAPPPDIAPPPAFIASYPDAPTHVSPVRAPRWPLVVVLLAGIAIIVCAYILLFAGDDAKPAEAKKSSGMMPAPDRMETMPAPPPVQIPDTADPWTQPPPSAPPGPPPAAPLPDLNDPFGTPPPNPNPPPAGTAPAADEFMAGVFDTMCQKAAQCGLPQAGVDACNLLSGSGIADEYRQQVRAGQCTYDEAKAARCLDGIRTVQCNGSGMDLDAALQTFLGISDCTSALVCR